MLTRKLFPHLALFALAGFGALLFASQARAQYKIEMQTCEELKITEAHYGINTVETATCVTPTTTFKPKGTLSNVNIVATFPAVPIGAGVTFMITKNDHDHKERRQRRIRSEHRLRRLAAPHDCLRQVHHQQSRKIFRAHGELLQQVSSVGTADFTVGEDTVGPRAAGNTAAGQGKVSICKEIDDNWNYVGESNEWKSHTSFNVLFKNPTPVGVEFIGIIFYKQAADGKDVEFMNEYQQNISEKLTE